METTVLLLTAIEGGRLENDGLNDMGHTEWNEVARVQLEIFLVGRGL
jgi:hypothetical protein